VPTPYREKKPLRNKVTAYCGVMHRRGEAFVCNRLDRGVYEPAAFGSLWSVDARFATS